MDGCLVVNVKMIKIVMTSCHYMETDSYNYPMLQKENYIITLIHTYKGQENLNMICVSCN